MILIIGANGFLGSHVLQQLSKQQVPIKATYRSKPKQDFVSTKNVTWVCCDILDVDALDEVMQDVQQVYHCANTISFNGGDSHNMMHNNVQGTANVVDACMRNNVQKLLFVSSVAAIAREHEGALITEKTPWLIDDSTSQYALSKYRAEMEVWRGQAEGLHVIVVNPSLILGEGNWDNGSTQLFKNAYREFPFYTAGVNGFVDVIDVALAMQLLMQSDIINQRFIINEGNHAYKDIFTKMALAFGKKPPHIFANNFLSNVAWRWFAIKSFFTGKPALITSETAETANANYSYDNTKLLKALPQFKYNNIDETIKRTCAFLNRTTKTPSDAKRH
jgi:dihydroflavonol-4-reductase